jgi:lipopolysaccharide/colanic/teichoic acid biosynthesis glycosyltransferase
MLGLISDCRRAPLHCWGYKGNVRGSMANPFSVCSGITFDQWMLLDLQYLDEWSLWLDFKILVKTVPAVLKGAGAV